jgi:DNA-damage-inducible protein J
MSQVNFRLDDNIKSQADAIFDELGLNMSTALTIFIKKVVRDGGIPFELTTREDPIYNPANMVILRKSLADYRAGKTTAHELFDNGD